MQRQITFETTPKQCHGCGRPPHAFVDHRGGHFAECSRCGRRSPHFDNQAEAVAAWNGDNLVFIPRAVA